MGHMLTDLAQGETEHARSSRRRDWLQATLWSSRSMRVLRRSTRLSAAVLLLGALGAAATEPSWAATGDTASCTYYLVGKSLPGYTDLVLPSPGTYRFSGPVTCKGQARGLDLPTQPGTMTITGTNGPASSCGFGHDAVHTEITFPAADPKPARPPTAKNSDRAHRRRGHSNKRQRGGERHGHKRNRAIGAAPGALRLSGDQTFTYVTFDGVMYGQLDGEQMIAQLAGGGDPDGHYGYCTKSDPFVDTAVSGHFILFDAQSGRGIDHQHVVTGYQYLPSGNAIAAAAKYVTAPEGPLASVGPGAPDKLLVNYPVTQGDSITFTSLDTHPHTVTACDDPCTAFHPALSRAFDGDIHLLGDQYTINTSTLKPGTYHYFCEIHPFMRGSFQVLPRPRTAAAAGNARPWTR